MLYPISSASTIPPLSASFYNPEERSWSTLLEAIIPLLTFPLPINCCYTSDKKTSLIHLALLYGLLYNSTDPLKKLIQTLIQSSPHNYQALNTPINCQRICHILAELDPLSTHCYQFFFDAFHDLLKLLECGPYTMDDYLPEIPLALFLSWKNRADLLQILIKSQEFLPNIGLDQKKTPFQLACQLGFVPVIGELVRYISTKKSQFNGINSLISALKNGHLDAVTFLLNHPTLSIVGFSFSQAPEEFLVTCNQYPEIAKQLLKDKRFPPDDIDFNAPSELSQAKSPRYSSLHFAVIHNLPTLFSLLLDDSRVDPNAPIAFGLEKSSLAERPHSLISLICHLKNSTLLEILLNSPKLNISPIHYPASLFKWELGYYLVIKRLLKEPSFDPNELTSFGIFHLHAAIGFKNNQLLSLLLEDPRIDVNFFVPEQGPPLQWSITKNNPEAARILLSHSKIDPNFNAAISIPPLSYSCLVDNIIITKLLLDHPLIDPNSIRSSLSPLLALCENREFSPEILKLLLNHPKININHMGKNKPHPLTMSLQKENFNLFIKLLLDPRTNPNIAIHLSNGTQETLFERSYRLYPLGEIWLYFFDHPKFSLTHHNPAISSLVPLFVRNTTRRPFPTPFLAHYLRSFCPLKVQKQCLQPFLELQNPLDALKKNPFLLCRNEAPILPAYTQNSPPLYIESVKKWHGSLEVKRLASLKEEFFHFFSELLEDGSHNILKIQSSPHIYAKYTHILDNEFWPFSLYIAYHLPRLSEEAQIVTKLDWLKEIKDSSEACVIGIIDLVHSLAHRVHVLLEPEKYQGRDLFNREATTPSNSNGLSFIQKTLDQAFSNACDKLANQTVFHLALKARMEGAPGMEAHYWKDLEALQSLWLGDTSKLALIDKDIYGKKAIEPILSTLNSLKSRSLIRDLMWQDLMQDLKILKKIEELPEVIAFRTHLSSTDFVSSDLFEQCLHSKWDPEDSLMSGICIEPHSSAIIYLAKSFPWILPTFKEPIFSPLE
jgi:ankyrin repeat protein